jgi:predicted anti-sigma-YlaC factor YlaD
MNDHLSDALIHEYLDEVLQPGERARATAHLSQCAACANRLAHARALFQALEELPEVALQRDLAPGVLDSINATRSTTGHDSKTLRRVFLGQLLAALVILVLAWPTIVNWLPVGLPSGYGQLALQFISTTLLDWTSRLEALNMSIQAGIDLLSESWGQIAHSAFWSQVSILEVTLLLASVTILWLAGNTLLLRSRGRGGRLSHFERRNL